MHMVSEIAFIKAKFNGLDADNDGYVPQNLSVHQKSDNLTIMNRKLSLDEVLHLCADVTESSKKAQVALPSQVPSKPVSQVDNGCVIS